MRKAPPCQSPGNRREGRNWVVTLQIAQDDPHFIEGRRQVGSLKVLSDGVGLTPSPCVAGK